jgi:hypothetical protein
LNHKPVIPFKEEEFEIALSHAKRLEPGKPIPVGPVTLLNGNETIKTDGLRALLGQYGESVNDSEMDGLFHDLLYQQKPFYGNMPSKFTVDEFVNEMIGFGAAPKDS